MTDSFDFQKTKVCKAAKEYQCCECETVIHIGDKYQNMFGVYEGYGDTFRTCLRCVEVRSQVQKTFEIDVMPIADMMQAVSDEIEYSDRLEVTKQKLQDISFCQAHQKQVDEWLAENDPWCVSGCGQFKQSFQPTCGDAHCVAKEQWGM